MGSEVQNLSLFFVHNGEEVEVCQIQDKYVGLFRRKNFVFLDEGSLKHYVLNPEELMKYCKTKNYISDFKVCIKGLREVLKND